LIVVSDFDRTLTKQFIDGQDVGASFDQVRFSGVLGADYEKRTQNLFDHYRPIELSEIPPAEKLAAMSQWGPKAMAALVEFGMRKELLPEVINRGRMRLRDGVAEFIREVTTAGIPLYVISAGLGDVIEQYLEAAGVRPNVRVIANYLRYDENNRAVGSAPLMITSQNKHAVISHHNVPCGKNAIVLGDTLEDANAAECLEAACSIKVGFLNKDQDGLLHPYSEAYDILVLNDGGMQRATELVREILS
jgi:HAD superfamily hydrolase (TIGR01544 family)